MRSVFGKSPCYFSFDPSTNWHVKDSTDCLLNCMFSCSGADQRKHQSFPSSLWPLWEEFTIDQWIPRTKGPVLWKMFPFNDVIINYNIIRYISSLGFTIFSPSSTLFSPPAVYGYSVFQRCVKSMLLMIFQCTMCTFNVLKAESPPCQHIQLTAALFSVVYKFNRQKIIHFE